MLVEQIPLVGEIYDTPGAATPGFDYSDIANPQSQITGIPIGEDKSDVHQIIQVLECIVQEFSMSPNVRDFVQTVVLCDIGDNDQALQVQQVLDFVQNNVKYLADPLNTEYVTSPELYIEEFKADRQVQGDCDDHVVLLNSMLGTLGIPTRVLGVKLPGSVMYDHVISSAYYAGEWHDIDPCAKGVPQPHYVERLIAEAPACGGEGGVPWGAIGVGLLFLL